MCRSDSEDSSVTAREHVGWRAAWQARRAAAQGGSQQTSSQTRQVTAGPRPVRDVWNWNFKDEFRALLAAVAWSREGAVLALDTEFPGFYCQESRFSSPSQQYEALRMNVDLLRPIQFGISVSDLLGKNLGTWTFNMKFNVHTDLHLEASLAFLEAAGVNFQRHATEGIDAEIFGGHLGRSSLVGVHEDMPQWITFAGKYDFGYLLKLLTGRPLPATPADFDTSLNVFCPRRFDLQDRVPHGSLEDLVRMYGIERSGSAHTAGSDAQATLELYFRTFSTNRSLHFQRGPSALQPPPGLKVSPVKHSQQEPPPELELLDSSDVEGQVSWGSAARMAMLSERAELADAAPSSLWSAFAREAAGEASFTTLAWNT